MKVYKLVSWVIIISFTIVFILLLTLSYEECIRYIAAFSGYSKPDKIAGLLTYSKLNVLRFMPLLGMLLGVIMLAFSKPLLRTIQLGGKWVRQIPSLAVGHLLEHTTNEFLILAGILLINLVVKIYLAIVFTITYDEAWTFINFTSRSIISSMTYYPAPNNHILHSILTNFFSILPLHETIALRIPAILANTFFVFFFYIFVRRLTNDKVTLLLTFIASFLVPVLYYGFASRGYSLVMLFFTVCYFMLIQLLSTPVNRERNLFYYSVCSALGFYTMPSFLYPYITLNIFLVGYALYQKQKDLAIRAVIWSLFTVALVLILYAPIFLISGISSITSNSYVAPIGFSKVLQGLIPHYNQTFEYLFNIKFAIVPVFAVVIAARFMSPRKMIANLNLWILVFAFIIPMLHSVIAFTRTWIYLFIPVLVSLGLILETYINGHQRKSLVRIAGVAIAILLSITSYRAILKQEDYAIEANRTNQYLLHNNIFSIYINEPLMDTYIVYIYKAHGLNLDCFIRREDFEQRKREIEMVLYKTGTKPDFTTAPPVFSNEYYDIYRNPYYIPN